ncbi:signal peptidase II [Fretibacter rubidus]|uniref:signal peptidase II n=1 Tax=Fretibacter rubidus TaxID=570162 RepID=UPI00352A16FA
MKKTLLTYALAIPTVIVIADQATKYWATRQFNVPMNICEINPRPGLQIEVSSIFDWALVCNQGVSWGLLQGDSPVKRWALTAFAFIMCCVLIYALTKTYDRLSKLAIALIIGGAIGNGIDRALFGAVTDFINFSDIGFHYVFNVADSAITVGVVVLIVASFLTPKSEDVPKT